MENLGERDTTVATGAKLPLQLIVVKCTNSFDVVDYSEYVKRTNELASLRKEGKLGSTD